MELCETGEKRFETTYGDGEIDDLDVEVEFADVGISWTKTFSHADDSNSFADRNGATWTEISVESFRRHYCQRHRDTAPGASAWTCDVRRRQLVSLPDAVTPARNCSGRRHRTISYYAMGAALSFVAFFTFLLLTGLHGCGCKKRKGGIAHAPAPANEATTAHAGGREPRRATSSPPPSRGLAIAYRTNTNRYMNDYQ